MATGTFSYQNESGYSDRLDNPEEYRTYNLPIGKGSVENQTNATVTFYAQSDGRGDSDYMNPGASAYFTHGFQSFKFTT